MNAGIRLSIEELRDLGAGVPAPPEAVALYRRAFSEYKSLALWSRREMPAPTIRHVINAAGALRSEGNMAAYLLAGQMEDACRAAL